MYTKIFRLSYGIDNISFFLRNFKWSFTWIFDHIFDNIVEFHQVLKICISLLETMSKSEQVKENTWNSFFQDKLHLKYIFNAW
jgi:hypothetical protein